MRCVINNFLYIVRSEKQVNYKPNSVESTFYHKDATLQQIVTRLSVHQATRNKNVIDLLSSIKTSIPYQQVVGIEIAIPAGHLFKDNVNHLVRSCN